MPIARPADAKIATNDVVSIPRMLMIVIIRNSVQRDAHQAHQETLSDVYLSFGQHFAQDVFQVADDPAADRQDDQGDQDTGRDVEGARMIMLMTSSPDMWDRVSFSAISFFLLCVESATIVCADIHSDERVIFD